MDSAYLEILKLNRIQLTEKYSVHKKFIDELFQDGILMESQYKDIKGDGLFDLEERMSSVKQLLEKKKGIISETSTSKKPTV